MLTTTDQLISRLQHANEDIRYQAILEIMNIKDPSIVEPLIKVLDDDDIFLRRHAITHLGILGDPRAIEPLLRLFNDPVYTAQVAIALAQMNNAQSRQALLHALQSKYDNVRLKAAEIFASYACFDGVEELALFSLISLLQDSNARLREASAQALGKLQDRRAVDSLLALVNDPDTDVSSSAITALGMIGDRQVGDTLFNIFQTLLEKKPDFSELPTSMLSGEARKLVSLIGALGDLVYQPALSACLNLLSYSQLHRGIRFSLLITIGQLGDQSVLDYLIHILKGDPTISARIGAALGLGFFRDPAALSHLEYALQHDQGEDDEFGYSVVEAANEAIERINQHFKDLL